MDKPTTRTSGGVEVTDALIERLAARAEQGYDLDSPRPARPSREAGGADTTQPHR